MMLALAAIWGGSFFFAEIALREVPPLTITLYRVALALPLLFAVVRLRRIPLPRDPRIWAAYLVMGGLNNAIPFSLIFWGQSRIEGGLASILNGTAAVFGAVNIPSVSLWASAGRGLQRALSAPSRLRLFNGAMAALLVATMLPGLVL